MSAPITLATLPRASAQQVFTQVALHLLTQGKVSYADGDVDSGCAYRGPDGLRCAAGCLIADSEYLADPMEGLNWSRLVQLDVAPMAHQALIVALQGIHDDAFPDDWRAALEGCARQFGLTMPEEAS